MSRAGLTQITQILERLQREMDADAPDGVKVLLVYAHPDDEAIALGGRLPLFRHALFVQATDGAPSDNADGERLGLSQNAYRAERALEQRAAFAAAGLPEARHRTLNLPDKAAAFHLPALTRQITDILEAERADVIFTHSYEGGHADHDACAFAVHQAAATCGSAGPLIVESPFYFADPDGGMHVGGFRDEDTEVLTIPLCPAESQRKRDAFAAFRTQQEVLQAFGSVLEQERFRLAPRYDFTRPACPGRAYYESFIPGLTATGFARLATEALQERRGDRDRGGMLQAKVVAA